MPAEVLPVGDETDAVPAEGSDGGVDDRVATEPVTPVSLAPAPVPPTSVDVNVPGIVETDSTVSKADTGMVDSSPAAVALIQKSWARAPASAAPLPQLRVCERARLGHACGLLTWTHSWRMPSSRKSTPPLVTWIRRRWTVCSLTGSWMGELGHGGAVTYDDDCATTTTAAPSAAAMGTSFIMWWAGGLLTVSE